MSRKEQLIGLIPEDSLELVRSVIDDIMYLETQLQMLRQLPFIQVHPKDATKQRPTAAAKQYKEFLQQYVNCVKLIEGVIYRDKRLEGDEVEESPLRKWFRENAN